MIPEPTTAASRNAVPSVSAARRCASGGFIGRAARRALLPADVLELGRERQIVEAGERQRDEGLDAVAQKAKGRGEGALLLDLGALDGGGVRDAPMRRHRMAGPERARLARGAVADGEHEIHRRRIGGGELVPAFRAIAVGGIVKRGKRLERRAGFTAPLGWLPAENA